MDLISPEASPLVDPTATAEDLDQAQDPTPTNLTPTDLDLTQRKFQESARNPNHTTDPETIVERVLAKLTAEMTDGESSAPTTTDTTVGTIPEDSTLMAKTTRSTGASITPTTEARTSTVTLTSTGTTKTAQETTRLPTRIGRKR